MKKHNFNEVLLDILVVSIGCILSAFAITSILKPNGLVTGGITGISIILDKLLHIKYTYIYYTISILVLVVAWISMGKKEAIKIITLSIVFPMVLIIFERLNITFVKGDMMLETIYFGIICGIGIGLILKRGFSQGGTDTIAKIIHKKLFPFVSISEILFGIDGTIIAASAIVYGKNIALYAIISQIILMKTINSILFGFGSKKVKMEIISENNQEITNYIVNTINRGVSIYNIKGGYKNLVKPKILTICSPRESMLIKRFIADIDSEAFVYVLPVVSVWGKGNGFEKLLKE